MSVTHAARHSLLRRYGNVGVGMCTQGDIKSEKEHLLLARALSTRTERGIREKERVVILTTKPHFPCRYKQLPF